MENWLLLAGCIASIIIKPISSSTNCSAIDSYVQVISSGNLSNTLLSSQALFPPYRYYVSFTELVALDSSIDNPCDASGISTNIANKIVLIFESEGNCTNHYKVFVSEQNNAIGVLLANNDLSGEVIPIIDDDSITTNIPMRSIPYKDGVTLQNEITNIAELVEIEFGCFDKKYPSQICIVDSLGDYWYLDGDYQRQSDMTYNDHPVYKKKGYSYSLHDRYIFLHDGNGDTEWYWAIINLDNFENSDDLRAICAGGTVSDPTLCSQWNATNTFNEDKNTPFSEYKALNVTAGLCPVSENYICITSKQSNLAGLGGTYRQFHPGAAYWFRELDDCDAKDGYLAFSQGSFLLIDGYNGWAVAECQLDSKYNSSSWDTLQFLPNNCTNWRTIVNGTLDSNNIIADDTFEISNTKCTVSSCIETTTAPNTICLSENGLTHAILEGEYNKTDFVGLRYGTPEYKSDDYYIWWYPEVDNEVDFRWWVISDHNLSTAIEKNGNVSIYSHCASEVSNPIDCKGWSFYFGNGFYYDDKFKVEAGKCIKTANEAVIWPEYVCVDFYNKTIGSQSFYLPAGYLYGGYAINSTDTAASDGTPYWVKPSNDYWPHYEVYMYYDALYGWWLIGSVLNDLVYANLACYTSNGYSPLDCVEWYDGWNTQMSNMYLYNCTDRDILTMSPTSDPTASPTLPPTAVNCSAINSYIQATSTSTLSETLLSAQALFPPYTYYVPPNELVVLDSSIDDICNPSGISTDIQDKIVLVFESDGSCTTHYKVFAAEQKNAIAVLIVNNDLSGEVSPIIDDDSVTTNIPTRIISYTDGVTLSDEISSGETVEIEFGCFGDDYPTEICVIDSLGDYYYLDGDYQRQADITFNDHPVYKKEGYSYLQWDRYIFLHDGSGDTEWYWAINREAVNRDPNFTDDSLLRVVCASGGISDPSLCPQWNGTGEFLESRNYSDTFIEYNALNVTAGLCSVSDNYICLTSKQSNLAGLGGTYRQFNSKTAYWWRELDDCDQKASYLTFSDGFFYLMDGYHNWIIAQCQLNTTLFNSSTWETVELFPNLCTEWKTIVNGTLQAYNLVPDDTFQISYEQCTKSKCIETTVPDTICLSENSLTHSFLEGQYDETGSNGSRYGTPEYKRTEPLSDGQDIYIWYYPEVTDDVDLRWWIIANIDLATAISNDTNETLGIYGFCESQTNNPVDCKSGWSFYFQYGYFFDGKFTVESGECIETTTDQPRVWPEYICIGFNTNETYSDILPDDYFAGGFEINSTGTALAYGNPHWMKPYNDLWGSDAILYYIGLYGWWIIGPQFGYYYFLCIPGSGYSPLDCPVWYDVYNTEMSDMYLYECTADDMLTASPTAAPTGIPTMAPTAFNCSAIDSYVQVLSSSSKINTTTLLSAQALFPPYTYYVPPTELVVLDSSIDDICDPSGISTDIENKIVLVFALDGSCTSRYKVFVAEENNAVAVVIADSDISGEVSSIMDDDVTETTIPVRTLSLADGEKLSDAIDAGGFVEIEFGCFWDEYSSEICVIDSMGDYWYLDGDYQRQADMTYNDHPVYKKERYVYLLSDYYIFLHAGDGDVDWYWAMIRSSDFTNDNEIRAVCAYNGISDPALCPQWNGINFFNPQNNGSLTDYNALYVIEGICSVDDNYICVSSKQSNLAGLGGTYRQFSNGAAYWFRELNDCDAKPGYLLFNQGLFYLYDGYNGHIKAMCQLDTNLDNSTLEILKFLPNNCTNWKTVSTGSLDFNNLISDDTFQISSQQCSQSQCNQTVAPDTICLSENGMTHSFLEGGYDKTDIVGSRYGTPEYKRKEPLIYDGQEMDMYIWWYPEVDEEVDLRWWVISSTNLTAGIDRNGSAFIYGICEAEVSNPADCKGWSFYFQYGFFYDDQFQADSGQCGEPTTTNEPRIWPEYICIDLINETMGTDSFYLPAGYFIGGYAINSTGSALSYGKPHWVKPYNDILWPYYEIYLYYDGFYGWWQIGSSLHNFTQAQLICYSMDGYSPIDCDKWYDYYNTEMSNIYLYECTADDILTASPTPAPTKSPLLVSAAVQNNGKLGGGMIALIVILVSLCVVCCIVTMVCLGRKDRGKAYVSAETGNSIEMNDTQPIRLSTMSDDGVTTGGFDMAPLNTEGIETIGFDDDDNDDDDDDEDEEDELPKDDDDDGIKETAAFIE